MAGRTLPEAEALCREHRMFPGGTHVLCAVSGGADSVCLLHWLYGLRAQWGFTLTAAHYNHNLRGDESRRDADFVRSFAETCCPGIDLVIGSGDVAGQAARNKAGIEETARDMRYTFLQETAQQLGADIIATAHNAEDNAETMLLHLLRGSGLRGLTGIPPRRGNLVRPLLTTRRTDIEGYLRLYGLPHIEDSSNADLRFTRNRVRHQLLPLLDELQPRFIHHMSQTAQLLTQDEEFLSRQAAQALGEPEILPAGLRADAGAIAHQPDTLAVRMVRLLLDRLNEDGGNCTSRHLLDITALCRSDDPSAQINLPNGLIARRVYNQLELVCDEPISWSAQEVPLPGTVVLPWGTLAVEHETYQGQPQQKSDFYLSCAKIKRGLTVRPRQTGDTLARPGRPGRTLKKILIDEKIPRLLRETVPVLDCGGLVAGVAGLGPDTAFLPAAGEPCWHIQCACQTKKGSFQHDGT